MEPIREVKKMDNTITGVALFQSPVDQGVVENKIGFLVSPAKWIVGSEPGIKNGFSASAKHLHRIVQFCQHYGCSRIVLISDDNVNTIFHVSSHIEQLIGPVLRVN
jgi:hypothetical protein